MMKYEHQAYNNSQAQKPDVVQEVLCRVQALHCTAHRALPGRALAIHWFSKVSNNLMENVSLYTIALESKTGQPEALPHLRSWLPPNCD